MIMDFPRLKNQFGFRLSVPSFIYPAGYVENVRRLGGYVDEIELLFFESDPGVLPSPAQISELAHLTQTLSITYNVHLPIDIDPSSSDRKVRLQALDRIAAVVELAAPLFPTTCTLHLPFHCDPADAASLSAWQTRSIQSLDHLLNRTALDPRKLSIETLDYPPAWLAPILAALPCAVCIDVGHILRHGFDLEEVLDDLASRTTVVHLHAATAETDHVDLSRLDPAAWKTLRPFLTSFEGSLSLEVFSPERLHASMIALRDLMGEPQESQG
jgi:sugar phosphate isomerase/epimerase